MTCISMFFLDCRWLLVVEVDGAGALVVESVAVSASGIKRVGRVWGVCPGWGISVIYRVRHCGDRFRGPLCSPHNPGITSATLFAAHQLIWDSQKVHYPHFLISTIIDPSHLQSRVSPSSAGLLITTDRRLVRSPLDTVLLVIPATTTYRHSSISLYRCSWNNACELNKRERERIETASRS